LHGDVGRAQQALRQFVPLATSDETGVAAAPFVMSTRTWVALTA
jgi:hypothetical protein